MKNTSINLVVAGLCLVSATALATGINEMVCGQTLGPGQNYTLKQDLTCGCGSPALIVVGPAKLNLKSYTVSCSKCDDPGDPGIVVKGNRAVVTNGEVSDCRLGIEVEVVVDEETGVAVDGKRHRFANLILSNNVRSGIRSKSSHSRFVNIRAYENGRRGLRIEGSDNKLIYNHAWKNGRQGIIIDKGDHNKVVYNTANYNCRDGIEIDGGNNNLLVGNIANGNGNPDACLSDEDAAFGEDFKPWFYGGINITVKDAPGGNLLFHNRAKDNLGCWIPPSTLLMINEDPKFPDEISRDFARWEKCIGTVPKTEDGAFDKDGAVDALRKRNLWDENAEEVDQVNHVFECTSNNKWFKNRSDGESNAKPECPCIEGIEGEDCMQAQ